MGLTEAQARKILRQQGYELVSRLGHIHALKNIELHVCLVKDLSTLTPAQFLQSFEDAIALDKKAQAMLKKSSSASDSSSS
jgi:hypothetical protein